VKIEQVKLDALIPYARNSRTHSDAQVAQIAASIKEFGFTNPVLIDETGSIIAGHGRVMAARKLAITDIPSIRLTHLTEAQKKAYVIADNKLALNAGWDDEMLAVELTDLKDMDFNLDLTGFSAEEIDTLLTPTIVEGLTDEDAVPELPPEPVTKLGDVWILGKHRVMCGDSTSIDAVEKLMDGSKAEIFFSDPPYGVSYAEKNKSLNAVGKGNCIQTPILNDHMAVDETGELWFQSFSNAHLVTTDKAVYYICGPQRGELMMMMMMMILKAGWQLKHTIIWVKNNHVLGRMDYHYKHEPIMYGWKDGESHNWYGDHSQMSTWEVNKPLKSALHPTMKPIGLMEKAIGNSTKAGNAVLDLFGGSGSTLIACEKTGRINRSMELDPKYCDVIVQRWQEFTGQTATLESNGEAFIPVKLAA